MEPCNNFVFHKGQEGARLTDRQQCLVQDGERHAAVGRPRLPLEPLAVVAHIDVGQVVEKPYQARHDGVQPVGGHLFAHEVGERPHGRAYPAIQYVARRRDICLR